MRVKIYGAGSIGNHLANGCRTKGWEVLICDTDQDALLRTKTEIYPSRYGKWDTEISLCAVDKIPDRYFDLVIVGTPPDSHMPIVTKELMQDNPPKIILIEKPACVPSLEGMQEVAELSKEKGVTILVGYNHVLTENTRRVEELVKQNVLGNVITLTAAFREYWGGIFAAHPWLEGPHDSYLGYSKRGGGACGEHSHAINIWLHFSHICKMGRIIEVTSSMDMIEKDGCQYDQIALLNVKTDNGYVGSIIQDVVTEPSQKQARIQGDNGYIEWQVNKTNTEDGISYLDASKNVVNESFSKTRPKDFQGELDHIESLLNDAAGKFSPISMQRGFDTMMVVAAAYYSHESKRTVKIDYSKGYRLAALEVI